MSDRPRIIRPTGVDPIQAIAEDVGREAFRKSVAEAIGPSLQFHPVIQALIGSAKTAEFEARGILRMLALIAEHMAADECDAFRQEFQKIVDEVEAEYMVANLPRYSLVHDPTNMQPIIDTFGDAVVGYSITEDEKKRCSLVIVATLRGGFWDLHLTEITREGPTAKADAIAEAVRLVDEVIAGQRAAAEEDDE